MRFRGLVPRKLALLFKGLDSLFLLRMQDSPAALGSSDSQGPKRKQTPGCRLALPTFALRWAAITSVRSPENTFTVLEHRTLSTMGNISSGKKSLLERAQSLSPAADARSALRPGLESSPTAPERFDGQQQAPTARKPPQPRLECACKIHKMCLSSFWGRAWLSPAVCVENGKKSCSFGLIIDPFAQ